MEGQFERLSFDAYGCRVIQKTIEVRVVGDSLIGVQARRSKNRLNNQRAKAKHPELYKRQEWKPCDSKVLRNGARREALRV